MKTKPYGVRFEVELLDLMREKLNIKTPQRALNYLSDKFILENIQGITDIKLLIPKIVKDENDSEVPLKEDKGKFDFINDRSNPLINIARERDKDGGSDDELEIINSKLEEVENNEIIDYQKDFNNCEFPEEYKALWDRINSDVNVSVKDKQLWKIRLNAK